MNEAVQHAIKLHRYLQPSFPPIKILPPPPLTYLLPFSMPFISDSLLALTLESEDADKVPIVPFYRPHSLSNSSG